MLLLMLNFLLYTNHILDSLAQQEPSVIVRTTAGPLEGLKWDCEKTGTVFHEFRSIPYGQPPLRERRFTISKPVESWKGVKNVRSWPHKCIQFQHKVVHDSFHDESENCLYLSVVLPEAKCSLANERDTPKCPVAVVVHGGGYTTGSLEDSRRLSRSTAARGFVVVNLQYRLGPFGFLSTGEESGLGNWAVHDILLGLKWTNENARFFGGKNDDVTLIGWEAGAALVEIVATIPQVVDYCHRTISIGGTMFSDWLVGHHVVRNSWLLSEQDSLQCDMPSGTQMITCLRTKTVEEIISAYGNLTSMLSYGVNPYLFTPNFDGALFNQESATSLLLANKKTLRPGLSIFSDHDCTGMASNALKVLNTNGFAYDNFTFAFRKIFSASNGYEWDGVVRRLALHHYLHVQGDKKNPIFLENQYLKLINDIASLIPQYSKQDFVQSAHIPMKQIFVNTKFSWKSLFGDNKINADVQNWASNLSELMVQFMGMETALKSENLYFTKWLDPANEEVKVDSGVFTMQTHGVELLDAPHRGMLAFWNQLIPDITRILTDLTTKPIKKEIISAEAEHYEDWGNRHTEL